jgi:hypothetical protein
MLAKIVFLFFAILVSISYVGEIFIDPIYQLLRDALILVAGVMIYAGMGIKFNQATRVFR